MILFFVQLVLVSVSVLPSVDASQQRIGIIGLWSDSECNSKATGDAGTSHFGEQDPINLNFMLSPDQCGVPGATVHSYLVRQMATCSNGSTSSFNYYDSSNCTVDPTDEDPQPTLAPRDGGTDFTGECLALIAFNSLAFVCDGVSKDNQKVNSITASSAAISTAQDTFPNATSASDGASSVNPTASAATVSSIPKSASSSLPSTFAASSTFLAKGGSISSNLSSSTRSSPATHGQGSKASISAGASAGIGVGSAVAAAGLLGALFFGGRRWINANYVRRNDAEGSAQPPLVQSPMVQESDAREIRGLETDGTEIPVETRGHGVHEADGAHTIHEMPHNT